MKHGFTLIELLVVVTIIVILLAILAPGLERAVYLTELMTCGARQHADVVGVQSYAMDFRRYYPNPPGGRSNQSFDHLGPRVGDGIRYGPELIPLFENRIPLDAFKCPMLGGISFDAQDNKPETLLFANYYMFFGHRYTNVAANKGMFKLGDALEYRAAAGAQPDRFRILMMDLNGAHTGDLYAMSSHPDTTGTMPKRTWQDALSVTLVYVTFARWQNGSEKTGNFRGPVDLNFAWDDGSVQRLDGLGRIDEKRTEDLPYYPAGSANVRIYVPPAKR